MAWLIPFLVHLVPWTEPRPLGLLAARFWATFVAVIFTASPPLADGLIFTAITAGDRPALGNHFGATSFELVTFVLITGWASGSAAIWLLAPLGTADQDRDSACY